MMQRILEITIFTMITIGFAAFPAAAQVSLDDWDFNRKPELVERLNETKENIDDKIEEAQEANNWDMANDLRRARLHVTSAVSDVQNASMESWDAVISDVEYDLNEDEFGTYDLYEDEDFWDADYDYGI